MELIENPMNATTPVDLPQDFGAVSVNDKFTLERGRAFMTGTHAIIRLAMLQRQRDLAADLNTAGFITGYRGSPVGGIDQTAERAKQYLDAHHVKFLPGVNEDLAATSLWGTQQVNLFNGAKYDGVFGMWYGKGPGVDRSADAFKHANLAGTSAYGGMLVVAGDDHAAKSSTTAHQSEFILSACGMPILYPASVQEYLDYGLHGWAMSRYSGLWVSMKCVTDVIESGASVEIDSDRVQIVLPTDFDLPVGGLNIRWPDPVLDQEARMNNHKWSAARAYARANNLDKVIWDSPRATLGIVAAGKSYSDTRQALADLGIDADMAHVLGIRLYKVGMTWPLEPTGIRAFSDGLEEILVVEEKRSFLEYQVKDALYECRSDRRPRVVGKFCEGEVGYKTVSDGEPLLSSTYELNATLIAQAITKRISRVFAGHPAAGRIKERFAHLESTRCRADTLESRPDRNKDRIPHFCSGCPHNSSTKVPEGSRALAGIGCHYMVLSMDRKTSTYTHMGAEGANWIGHAPFTREQHVFANLGDGTYFHSGLLAIRAAVSAKVNMTYKILYNDAVALTGGQVHDGPLDPAIISRQLAAEGVAPIVVVSDAPEKYPAGTDWAPGVTIHHRSKLDVVQRELRQAKGVSALIYDQTCASEKRRRRKRNAYPDPARRVVINDAVCEGCGDCSAKSNCLSVEPLETAFGRKRQINQSSCNKDFSCVDGFCPSFVTVTGGKLRKPEPATGTGAQEKQASDSRLAVLGAPPARRVVEPYSILVAGIGGTGVITVGQIVAMAAHLEHIHCSVLDMSGLAQKGGPVFSHIWLSAGVDDIHATRIGLGAADVVLGCDALVAASFDGLSRMSTVRTKVVMNSTPTPTAAFVRNPDWQDPGADAASAVRLACGEGNVDCIDAGTISTELMGDSIATNMFMLGFAWQKGLVPLSEEAIVKAISLNGVSVDFNTQSFAWGRRAAHDWASVQKQVASGVSNARVITFSRKPSLEEVIRIRSDFLVKYQNASYARRYREFIDTVSVVETSVAGAKASGLTEAVAHALFKLMTYKDEYEVARLHSDPAFRKKIASMFDGDYKLNFHLAPPLFAKRGPDGNLRKRMYGPWMSYVFQVLATLRFLRGTPFDVFGYTNERKGERKLIDDYRNTIQTLLPALRTENLAVAVDIASLPMKIRGFGHVKEKSVTATCTAQSVALASFFSVPVAPVNRA